MTPNSSDDPGAPESGPNTTTSQFSHENPAGEFNRSDYSRDEYGSRGEYGSGTRSFVDRREPLEIEELERRRYMGESRERRGSMPELRMEFQGEGPYGSYRGYYGSHLEPMEASYSRGSLAREEYFGHEKMNRPEGGSVSRQGYTRDNSPYRRDRFDSGPLGRPGYGISFDKHGYGKDYSSRQDLNYGSDYGRALYGTDYERSRYGGYGDVYGSQGYGYSGGYGSPGYGVSRPYAYGDMNGRDYSPYGYARDCNRYAAEYERIGCGGGYGGSYGLYGYSGQYGRSRPCRPYGGNYSRYGDFAYGRYPGRDQSPYGIPRSGYDVYSSPYIYGYGYPARCEPHDFNRFGTRQFGKCYDRGCDQTYRRGPYGQLSAPMYGPYGYPTYAPPIYAFGYGGLGHRGYERYHGMNKYPPMGGGYGRSPYDQDKLPYGGRYSRDRYGYNSGQHYGHGGYQGYKGSGERQYGYEEGQYNKYRSGGPFEGRGPYGQRPSDQGHRWGASNYTLDHYGVPPPFPPFSQPRSFYPTSFEFYDEEDHFGRLRFSRAKEMAVRVNFDLQRRKFYENVTDSAQNPDFKVVPSRRGEPRFPVDTLRVEFVDFLPKVNSKEHRTLSYELVQSGKPTSVLRRGQAFFMEITFQNRDFNPNRDCLFLNFYLGPNPSVPKKTRIVLPVTLQKEFHKAPNQWDVRIHNQEAGRLTLQVHIPATASIGCWNCVVETSTRHFKRSRRQYRPSMDIYIIFNPFTPEDSTFMDNDDLRTEYLMSDRGKIFMGGFKSAKGRPWVYGQFDDCVLPAVCVLLEMSKLAHSEWGNPVKVVRAISSMIKAARSGTVDSSLGKCSGLIIPRYEEDFRGGSSPHLWTGSVQIIEEFLKGGASPVKYGHCWVMAALMTTFCRALGLPSRPVTAFVSAISTQDSMTVDKYIDRYGDLLERGPGRDQPDSLWAFHTWCDIWMMRPDLPAGNSGWQACDPSRARRDATESEYQGACGPCSSEAIRKGDIGFERETDAFYSVLNAYVRYFYEAEQSEWGFLPFMQFRFPVARYILTKAPNRIDDDGDEDFEDVTSLYKTLELPQEEKLTIYNAFRGRNRAAPECDYEAASSAYGPFPMVKEGEELDVAFEFQEPVRVALGEPLTIAFSIHNTSESIRTIQANISVRSVFYTGVMGPHVKRITGQFTLEADQGETLTLRIDPVEYQEKLIDMSFFKVTVTGFVRETLQSFVDEFDFRFDKPKLLIEIPEECDSGKECPFDLSFINPLGMTLTECFVTFEVSGAVRPKTVQIDREVAPRSPFQFHSSFVPRRKGLRHMVACFTSKQLSDINGMRKIFVRE